MLRELEQKPVKLAQKDVHLHQMQSQGQNQPMVIRQVLILALDSLEVSAPG